MGAETTGMSITYLTVLFSLEGWGTRLGNALSGTCLKYNVKHILRLCKVTASNATSLLEETWWHGGGGGVKDTERQCIGQRLCLYGQDMIYDQI